MGDRFDLWKILVVEDVDGKQLLGNILTGNNLMGNIFMGNINILMCGRLLTGNIFEIYMRKLSPTFFLFFPRG